MAIASPSGRKESVNTVILTATYGLAGPFKVLLIEFYIYHARKARWKIGSFRDSFESIMPGNLHAHVAKLFFTDVICLVPET